MVLREPAYRELFKARSASLIGDAMTPVAMAFALLDLGGSPVALGTVFAAHSVVVVALVLLGGVVADRSSPRLVMLSADLLRSGVLAIAAVLMAAGAAAIWELGVLYAVSGIGTAFFNPASNAIVAQVVPTARLQDGNALLEVSRSAGKIAGPAFAGISLTVGSPALALAANAAAFSASALYLLRLQISTLSKRSAKSSIRSDLRRGWREFTSRTWLWSIVVGAAFANAVEISASQVLGPVVARESLGGPGAWAVIATAWGFGAAIGGLFGLSVRPRRPLLLGEGLLLLTVAPIVLLAIPAPVSLIVFGAAIGGGVASLAQILYETTWVQLVPAEARSRVAAYDWFGSLALQPLGLAIVGPVAAVMGTSETLWICAAAMTVILGLVFAVPSVRHLEVGHARPSRLSPAPIEPGDY
jgi:MFS family permease